MIQYYTLNFFAEKIGKTPPTVRRWYKEGRLLQSARINDNIPIFSEEIAKDILVELEVYGRPGIKNKIKAKTV